MTSCPQEKRTPHSQRLAPDVGERQIAKADRVARNYQSPVLSDLGELLHRSRRDASMPAPFKTSAASGSTADAIKALRYALLFDPTDVQALFRLICVTESSGLHRDANEAWLALATALRLAGAYPQAAIIFRVVLDGSPSSVRALSGAGRVYLALAEPLKAIECLKEVVRVTPENGPAHTELGGAYHLADDRERGWDEFAWQYAQFDKTRNDYEQPLWDGSSLDSRTILLWTAQGLGDSIQFLRYVQHAKQMGGRVIVSCHIDRLVPLVEHVPGVDRAVFYGDAQPDFDTHAPLVYLPSRIRELRWPILAQVPYIAVDPALVQRWRDRLARSPSPAPSTSTRLTVGACWSGNASHPSARSRFTSIASFLSLAGLPIRWISLQRGTSADDLLRVSSGLRMEQIQDDSCSLADTAALIASLDLVITVDTMIAHLTGALGRPVWTTLRYATNWRWGLQGDSTPWYPTMRLFRQEAPGDWEGVFRRVRGELQRAVSF